MKLVALVVALLCACGSKKEAPPRNEFEAFERELVAANQQLAKAMRANGRELADKDVPRQYRAIFLGPSGLFVDRKLVAKLDELDSRRDELAKVVAANLASQPTWGFTPTAAFDIDDQPAKVAIAALRLFAGHEVLFTRRRRDPDNPLTTTANICATTLRTARNTEEEMVVLSVLLATGRTWIGLSRVNEFQEIPAAAERPDFEKLQSTLKEHKRSAFFTDRADIELGAEAGTSGDILTMLGIACDTGFIDVAVLPVEELGAVPKL